MRCPKCDELPRYCECARPTHEMADELTQCQDAIVELHKRLTSLELQFHKIIQAMKEES